MTADRPPVSGEPPDMTEELALMRDISDRLRRIEGTTRIIVAARLMESGRASSWIEAVGMARKGEWND